MAIRKLQYFPFFAVLPHTAAPVAAAILSRSRHTTPALTKRLEHAFRSVQGTFRMR